VDLVGRIDEDLGGDVVEPPLDALSLGAAADHIDIEVAGGRGRPADDRAGGDDAQQIGNVLKDKGDRLAQGLSIRILEGRPLTLG
jgi:hypothetical protein